MNPTEVYTDVFYPQGSSWAIDKIAAVRVTHRPSGLYAESNEGRSQHANKAAAWAELEKKVATWEEGKATLDALAREFEEEAQRAAVEQATRDYNAERVATGQIALDYETWDHAQPWPFNQELKQKALDNITIGFLDVDSDFTTLRKEFETWAERFGINTDKAVKYVNSEVEGSWQDFLKSRELN